MGVTHSPFYRTHLQEKESGAKKEKGGVVITLRLNSDELARIDSFMQVLNTDSRGTAIKLLIEAGANVLQGTLGLDFLRWLCSGKRRRSE